MPVHADGAAERGVAEPFNMRVIELDNASNAFNCVAIVTCQVELLKAASQSKEVPYKIAYGLTLNGMRQWGLYISKPRWGPCCH